jgi:hypothetical protein
LANWSKDFSEIETPILIKYAKTEVKNKWSVQFGENKKISKKEQSVFIVLIFREKNAHMLFHIMVKLKVLTSFCSTFVLLVGEKII